MKRRVKEREEMWRVWQGKLRKRKADKTRSKNKEQRAVVVTNINCPMGSKITTLFTMVSLPVQMLLLLLFFVRFVPRISHSHPRLDRW